MRSILIVEEDRQALETLEKFLVDMYEVRQASSGVMAITELRRKISDLIVMALDLPDVDGGELTQRLRRNRRYEKIPIILMASKADRGRADLSIRKGVNDFVIRPVDYEELLRKIQNQLGEDTVKGPSQRKAERYIAQWRVDYQRLRPQDLLKPPEGHRTSTVNISEGGIAFFPLSAVSSGNICVFAIYPSEQNRPILVIGQIAWCRSVKERWLAGAKWLAWESEEDKVSIMKAVQLNKELQAKAAQSEN